MRIYVIEMAIWNLKKVTDVLLELKISEVREAENLAGWVWEEVMEFSSGADKNLTLVQEEKIQNVIQRILTGEPVQYIAGHAWFYGLKLKVTPDVLIPRPETEELVAWILEDLKRVEKKVIRILDIGTGSGCIPIALKQHLKERAFVFAVDVSEPALDIAAYNAEALGLEIAFSKTDFLEDDLGDLGLFDVIVSNPPYISRDFDPKEKINQLRFEPSIALYPSGDDPDIFYKKMAKTCKKYLVPGGSCYLEMNEFSANKVKGYFENGQWSAVLIRKDLQDAERMLKVKS